ncbi:hypothetical protein MKZ38_002463 [Zalerion maritima]|uniref:HIG1 domain-containing protein n=1 Tax=Zalerion maritima TaxID=339359 RepID=A0AAD5RNZ8_9PEZI|nr:hypothetical protein MKZ38_002463 [Zalerion maritima]
MSSPADGSMPSSFDQDQQYNEKPIVKIVRRFKEEPLIPLGVILTCTALINATLAMKRGDKQATNRMFRARVYAQGFTIAAIVAGGSYYGADRKKRKELDKVKAEKEAEERRQQWIHELEVRDEEDKAFRDRLVKRKEKRDGNGANIKEAGSIAEQAAEKQRESGGTWFGGWSGGGTKSTPPGEKKKEENKEAAKEPEKLSEPSK